MRQDKTRHPFYAVAGCLEGVWNPLAPSPVQATVREVLTALAEGASIGKRDVSLGVKIHQERENETQFQSILYPGFWRRGPQDLIEAR